ncbi:MAG: hypothetical protein E7679_00455 [Ruminococcaceae bacterium]|nr:hypothetical protein [Oscillospiraceae bacterium]
MQIDRQSLERLLTLNDRQLKAVITKLAADSGIDPASFNMNTSDVDSIRRALSSASDADLSRIAEMYEQNKKRKK